MLRLLQLTSRTARTTRCRSGFLPRKASEVFSGRRPPRAGWPACSACFSSRWARLSEGVRRTSTAVIRPAVLGRRGRVPPPLHQVRTCIRVCPRTSCSRPLRGGRRRALDPDHDLEDGLLRAHCTLCIRSAHGRHPRDLDRPRSWASARSRPRADQDRHRLLQPRPLLPWAWTRLRVCEEVCPVSPKAIFTRNVEVTDRWGATSTEAALHRPVKCIGCGICEHECPVKDDPAVYVTAIGETRDKSRSLLLSLVADGRRTSSQCKTGHRATGPLKTPGRRPKLGRRPVRFLGALTKGTGPSAREGCPFCEGIWGGVL